MKKDDAGGDVDGDERMLEIWMKRKDVNELDERERMLRMFECEGMLKEMREVEEEDATDVNEE